MELSDLPANVVDWDFELCFLIIYSIKEFYYMAISIPIVFPVNVKIPPYL